MKKHTTYCNPGDSNFNWEKPFDVKNLPGKLEGYKRVKVTFEKFIPRKSLKQLGYYRGGVLPFIYKELFEDTGLSQKDWHAELKTRFGLKKKDKTGSLEVLVSHADYSEKEMAQFITEVINWTRDFFRLEVPTPTVIEEYID